MTHLSLAVAVTGVVDAVSPEDLVELGPPDLLVLAPEELVRGEVAVEVLLYVLGAALVRAGGEEASPGGWAALHLVLGAAEVEPGAGPAARRDPLPAPLPHLPVVPEARQMCVQTGGSASIQSCLYSITLSSSYWTEY